jgi:hypothetical protein
VCSIVATPNGRQLIAKAPTEKKTNTTEDDKKTKPEQPLSDISLNGTNIHDVDQQQRTGESISGILMPESTGVNTISALLNHDDNAPAAAFATTHVSLQGSRVSRTEPVSGVAGTESFRFY